ncbi:MAG: class I SAM-dependent methyltransferase [bacterium]
MNYKLECISCGCKEFKNIAVNSEFNMLRDITRCNYCDLAFVNPMPDFDEIQRFYNQQYSLKYKSYHRKKTATYLVGLFSWYFTNMRIKERFRYLASKGIGLRGKNILEIGSANGKFLHELKKRGARVGGVEPSKLESSVSTNKFNITPTATSIQDLLSQHKNAYDIIFSYHVLEHLGDPTEELKDIKQLLKDGGYFIGEVPYTPKDVDSLEQVIRESVFNNLHLFHFNTKSISNLLEKTGFDDIEIERLEFKSIFKKIYPQANIHYLHPSYERKLVLQFFSFLQAVELVLKSFVGKPTMGAQILEDLEAEWRGPNDWIRFCARV